MKTKNEKIILEDEEEGWDLKKILLGLFIVSVIISFFLYSGYKSLPSGNNILGITSERERLQKERDSLLGSAKDDAQVVIDQVKKDVEKLSADNLGTSTEQIQKIINNLRSLQEIKDDGAFDIACKFVCKK